MVQCNVLWSGKYSQNWEVEPHKHSYWQIIAISKGGGVIQINGEQIRFSEQDVFLIHPYETHAVLRDDPDKRPQIMDLKFTVEDGAFTADLSKLPTRLDGSFFPEFQYYFDCILRESEESFPYSYDRICMFLGLALTTLLRTGDGKGIRNIPSGPEEPQTAQVVCGVDMRKITQYIYQNYASPISLEDLAKEAFVSKSTLIRSFKLAFDTTPIKFINSVRLKKAKALLLNTDSCVSEISEMVGFQSLHYFSRVFKGLEKISPVEYRQRYSKNIYYTYRVPVQSEKAEDL